MLAVRGVAVGVALATCEYGAAALLARAGGIELLPWRVFYGVWAVAAAAALATSLWSARAPPLPAAPRPHTRRPAGSGGGPAGSDGAPPAPTAPRPQRRRAPPKPTAA